MTQTKAPRTEALVELRRRLMATMGYCVDALRREKQYGIHSGIAYYQGKIDGFASCLGLLDTLGPQIEEEASEQGYEQGSQEAYDNPRKPSR